MVALAIGLVALSATLTAAVITCGVWLHSANADKESLRDTLDAEQAQSQEWRAKYETEVVTHGVCIKQRDTEHELRAIAEARLKEAQGRLRTYLAQNLRNASEDDINAALADLFASPLGIVPAPVPRRSDHPTDGLLPLD